MHKVWQQVRWYTLVVIIATFVCIPLPGSAQTVSKAGTGSPSAQTRTTAEPAKPKAKTPPPVGQCASPHNSIHTLLVHLQDDDKYNPGRASACISREGLGKPADAPRLAIKFKKVLDARGLYVVLDDLPSMCSPFCGFIEFRKKTTENIKHHCLGDDVVIGTEIVGNMPMQKSSVVVKSLDPRQMLFRRKKVFMAT